MKSILEFIEGNQNHDIHGSIVDIRQKDANTFSPDNVIQSMFPTSRASHHEAGKNVLLLTDEDKLSIKTQKPDVGQHYNTLQQQLLLNLDWKLQHSYGLKINDITSDKIEIIKTAEFDQKVKMNLNEKSGNEHQKVTRMIVSLRQFNLPQVAVALFNSVKDIKTVPAKSVEIWQRNLPNRSVKPVADKAQGAAPTPKSPRVLTPLQAVDPVANEPNRFQRLVKISKSSVSVGKNPSALYGKRTDLPKAVKGMDIELEAFSTSNQNNQNL